VYTVFAVEGGSALVVASLLTVWARRRFTSREAISQVVESTSVAK
jgi:hypothetical protein